MKRNFVLIIMFFILFSLIAAAPNQNNAIANACRDNLVKQVEDIIKKGVDLNVPTSNGFSILYVAVSVSIQANPDNTKIVQILLDNGANPNLQGEKDEEPVLILAIMSKNVAVAKLLLDHNADPNKKDKNGLSPYFYASTYAQNKEIVDTLLAKGANP